MKRTVLFALMIPLLLTGCGARRNAERWKSFAEAVEAAEHIAFHAEITALWEDAAASFAADVERTKDETVITLTAPETVSGITVRAKDGAASVEFDGVILSLDAGRSERLSPCGAPHRKQNGGLHLLGFDCVGIGRLVRAFVRCSPVGRNHNVNCLYH